MSPAVRLVNPDGSPTRGFIGAWSAKGATRGLPARFAVTNPEGGPTALLVALAREGLGLTLRTDDAIVDADGRPTLSLLTAWSAL